MKFNASFILTKNGKSEKKFEVIESEHLDKNRVISLIKEKYKKHTISKCKITNHLTAMGEIK